MLKENNVKKIDFDVPFGLIILSGFLALFGFQQFVMGLGLFYKINFPKILALSIFLQGIIYLLTSMGFFLRKKSFYPIAIVTIFFAYVVDVFYNSIAPFFDLAVPAALLNLCWYVLVIWVLYDFFHVKNKTNNMAIWFKLIANDGNQFKFRNLFNGFNTTVILLTIFAVAVQISFGNQY